MAMEKHLPSAASTSQEKRQHRARALLLENLEPRCVLSADLAEIVGVVVTDLTDNGRTSDDVPVVGAPVRLYRDGGNDQFDQGSIDDAMVGAATSTNAQGAYDFRGLSAGTYFVVLETPSDLMTQSEGAVRRVEITTQQALGTDGLIIDAFDSSQMVMATPPLPASDATTHADSTVLGESRDMYVELLSASDPLPFDNASLAAAGGQLAFQSAAGVTANASITWDGSGGSSSEIDPTGLGGIDFTEFDGNRMTGVGLRIGADHPNSNIKLRFHSDAVNWSEYLLRVPATTGGLATSQVIVNFDDVPSSSGGSGVDFSNVGAIRLTFEGVTAVDGRISLISGVGVTTKKTDFLVFDRLSIGDRVWTDLDNDGQFDPGEPGIANVALALYEDADGNGAFSAAADRWLSSTTSDAQGSYMFGSLMPGDYIVQVVEENFLPGGPLAGLTSSTGNLPTPDPDDDVDSDDNGDPLAGQGIVARAVSLVARSEPTDDGDQNYNTNRSVDFGFFGFDVTIDKSVDARVTSPGDQLTYAILVTNHGPTTARDVRLVDVLPSDVQFTSGARSVGDGQVSHANGEVRADLGTLRSGESASVTIIVDVLDHARGALLNTARVSATDEANTTNNAASAESLVEPKIDLAITKDDQPDPVRPGDQLAYTLRVTNHGPSAATGVVVTDELPATGVSFAPTASSAGVIADGKTLSIPIGDLASGDAREFRVVVDVASNFAGELVNHAEVAGNETETRLDNNADVEVTLVERLPASVGGTVFIDRNDNGIFEPSAGESPLSGVVITLSGETLDGFVTREMTTDASGQYLFGDLAPGIYSVVEKQPARYRDGQDTVGSHGGSYEPQIIQLDDGTTTVNDVFRGIILEGGDDAEDYDFGELALPGSSKRGLVVTVTYA